LTLVFQSASSTGVLLLHDLGRGFGGSAIRPWPLGPSVRCWSGLAAAWARAPQYS
jgi:hypothetical protein